MLKGPNIKAGLKLPFVSNMDVAPTLLYLMGLPINYIDSYEYRIDMPYTNKVKMNYLDYKDILEELRSLGYLQ